MIDLSKYVDYPMWVKMLAATWVALTLFLSLIIVFWRPEQKTQKEPPPTIPQPIVKPAVLPKEQVEVLILLSKQGELFTFQIAKLLDISEDIAKYHLQELRRNKFVAESSLPYRDLPGQHSWNITDKGKKYLIENKLIF